MGWTEVTNDEGAGWTEWTAWRLEEDLRLGGVGTNSGDALSFGDVVSIAADSKGSMYVLDWLSQDIRVFDHAGSLRYRIGRRGSGPGEFMGARFLTVGPGDTLWVLDDAAGRISIFSPDGTFLRQHRRHATGYVPSAPGKVLDDGSFLDWRIITPEGRMGAPVLYQPLRLSAATGQVDSFPPLEHRWTMLPSGRLPETFFGGTLVMGVGSNSDLWFAHSRDYRVFRRRIDGDTLLTFRLNARPAPLGSRERAVIQTEFGHIPPLLSEYLDALPATRPIIHRLLPDGAGHVMVFVDVADEPKGSVVDVFQEEGNFLGRLRLPHPLPLGRPGPHPVVYSRDGYLYAVVFDDLDIPHVSRMRLIPGASVP